MERVHQVSEDIGRVDPSDEDTSPSSNRNGFVVRGGCPFRAFHRERFYDDDSGDTSAHLARAMEDFSLSAIMGRMAELGSIERATASEAPEYGRWEEASCPASPSSGATPSQGRGDDPSSEAERRPPLPPLSRALKAGTVASHAAAEDVRFVKNFARGAIKRDLYAELVAGLHHVYAALEALLDRHAPAHFPSLHFPRELGRAGALREDMEYWHGPGWETGRCRTPSPAVRDYVARLEEIGRVDPLLLLSHAYTTYLGDLSGEKVLARVARRALGLGRGRDGLRFYHFERVRSAKLFKDRYREALDGLAPREDAAGRLVAEANVAFALNMRVFEELDVRGGVAGARVQDVGEALRYYDAEVEAQRSGARGEGAAAGEEAKCPFGFVGGSNPHGPATGEGTGEGGDGSEAAAAKEAECPFGFVGGSNPHGPSTTSGKTGERAARAAGERAPPSSSIPASSGAEATTEHAGGRCPWPFVFLHDPATGSRGWRTWFAVGLALCWSWSRVH